MNPLPIPLHVMSGWRTRQRPNHEGIDLTAPVGTPVMSVRPGRVTHITGNDGPAGCSIIVEHTADDETRYNHLRSKPRFRLGERVGEGQVLGHVGMTGRTTAPHLHFARYRRRSGRWVDVDPRTLLDFSATAGGDARPITPTPKRKKRRMSTAVIYTKGGADKNRRGAVLDTDSGLVSRFGWFPPSYADALAKGFGLEAAAPVTGGQFDVLTRDVAASKGLTLTGEITVINE